MQNQNSLIIVIDVHNHKPLDVLAQDIKDYIENKEHIKAVCLATYNYKSADKICCSGKYWKNSKEIFNDTISIDFIRQCWNSNTIEKNITHDLLMDIEPREDCFFFSASSPFEIIYYCNNVNQSINSIYWAGVDWKHCVKTKPVGYNEIINCYKSNLFKNNISFHTNSKLIATRKGFDTKNLDTMNFSGICEPQDNWALTDDSQEWLYKI